MSKYTTEVRYICEYYSGASESVGFNSIEDILGKSWDKVFDFDFPLFDENYRQALCTKILRHFYTREIGEETVGLWKLRLDTRLNDIMPYYNKLYESETLKINPLYTFNFSKSHKDSGGDERVITESGTENSVTDGTNKTVNSGSDSVAIDGTNTSTDSGNDVVSIEGSNTITNSGTDSISATGTNKTIDSGSDTIVADSSVGNTTQNKTEGITTNTVVTTKTEKLKDRYSDTPQGGLTGIESDNYLTNARLNDNSINQNDTNNGSTSGNSKEVSTGQSNSNQSTTYGKVSDISSTSSESTTYGKVTDNTNQSSQNTTYGKSTSNTNKSTESTTFGKQTNNTITNIVDVTNSKNTSDTITTTREYVESVMGSSGKSDSELLLEYRSTFLNIDLMVINELNDLFINIW